MNLIVTFISIYFVALCNSDRTEQLIGYYLVTQGMIVVIAAGGCFRILSIVLGYGEIPDDSMSIWISFGLWFVRILNLLLSSLFVFKLIWFVMFLFAYTDESVDCLEDVDPIYDEEFDKLLKSLFIIEAIPFAVFALLTFCVYLLCPITLCFLVCAAVTNREDLDAA